MTRVPICAERISRKRISGSLASETKATRKVRVKAVGPASETPFTHEGIYLIPFQSRMKTRLVDFTCSF